MKNDEVRHKILQVFCENPRLTANEIHELIPEEIAMIQIYNAIKTLVTDRMMKVDNAVGQKFYYLIGSVPDKQPLKKEVKSTRDNTKYKFNGIEYGKGRLAHAIISFYVKKNKPTYKKLCKVFPINLTPPYGLIKPKQEALELSKERARFFIKEHEQIKLPDGLVCVSNQFTKDRINKMIKLAQEDLGYKIE
tara:strand:- start:4139 stop:4714 length:576 start_codon:yes stop_codon:yes gene_type:complete